MMRSLLLLLAVGCGGVEKVEGLDSWQGAASHLMIEGTLNQEQLALDVNGAGAADISKLWCEREYEVPVVDGEPDYASGRLIEFKLVGLVPFGDETRRMELEFKQHDFQSDSIGSEMSVVPRIEARDIAADEIWLEWEWHTADESMRILESAAVSGTMRLEAYTGQIGADGLTIDENTGYVGGFFDASWSNAEHLVGSFSVPCSITKVEQIE